VVTDSVNYNEARNRLWAIKNGAKTAPEKAAP